MMENEEIWKPIDGYPAYEISSLGRVKNSYTGKILKPGMAGAGYLQVNLSFEGKTKYLYIHRLVAQAFIPNPDNKPTVNHVDGIKTDNRIENLEWCSNAENTRHAYKIGLKICNQTTKNAISKANSKIRNWYHPQYGAHTCSTTELVRKYPELNLRQPHLSKVALKIRSRHRGWTCLSDT